MARLLPRCITRPEAVVSSPAGTLHCCAAAATSICRTAAPTWRIGSQFVGVAVLPAAICPPYFCWFTSAPTTVTLAQSTSSSSAISIGSMFIMPWPISGFLLTIVTLLSGCSVTNAHACGSAAGPPGPWANTSSASSCRATSKPPPAAALTLMKERRFRFLVMAPPLLGRATGRRDVRWTGRGGAGRDLDRFADAHVGTAAAQVAGHRGRNLRVRRTRSRCQQRRCRHDLAGLAVAALRHVDLLPRALQGMRAVRRQAFDGHHGARGCLHRRGAGAHRAAVEVHRAGAALCDAAAELRPLQIEDVSEHPEQGHVTRDIHGRGLPVHVQSEWHNVNSQQEREIADKESGVLDGERR